jgi:hypothetical protein
VLYDEYKLKFTLVYVTQRACFTLYD